MRFGVPNWLMTILSITTSGFDIHILHENMNYYIYVINGELTHKDSLGNIETLTRGDVQYLSADAVYIIVSIIFINLKIYVYSKCGLFHLKRSF